jgi:glutamate racemase
MLVWFGNRSEEKMGETRRILKRAGTMLEKNIDTVVLGCTHYPFVIPLIQQIVGESVRVIDPAPAVAKQTGRLLEAGMRTNLGLGRSELYTSGRSRCSQILSAIVIEKSRKLKGQSGWMIPAKS